MAIANAGLNLKIDFFTLNIHSLGDDRNVPKSRTRCSRDIWKHLKSQS